MSGRRAAAAVVTFVFVMSIAMLMRIAYAGVVFDGQPASPTKDGGGLNYKRPGNRQPRPMPSSAHRQQAMSDPVADAPPPQAAERVPLSLELAVDLVLCGVLLAGVSLTTQHLQPDFPRLTLFTGVAGGGLCILWGILGRRGTPCRMGAMMTLAAVACVHARQAVQSWETSAEVDSKGRMVAAVMTMLVVFCVGMLANLVREGKGPQP